VVVIAFQDWSQAFSPPLYFLLFFVPDVNSRVLLAASHLPEFRMGWLFTCTGMTAGELWPFFCKKFMVLSSLPNIFPC
jgi:hypothetical protein